MLPNTEAAFRYTFQRLEEIYYREGQFLTIERVTDWLYFNECSYPYWSDGMFYILELVAYPYASYNQKLRAIIPAPHP